jgi:nucleoside-diphosphate-sugar epimerase
MPDDKKHFLITGGSGFLGINLIRYLLERGHTVSNIDFAPFDYPDSKDKIRNCLNDIRDREAVDRAMEGVDIVVHCAAALPLYKAEDIYTTDIDGTRNILESALKHGVERVIHISSTAVYGIPDHHPLVEDDQLYGVGPYGEAKVKAEEVAKDYRAKGLTVPIIRPKSFIGPERLGVFALLYDWALDGKNWPVLGKGNNPYQYLDVEDLCDAIYLTATLPAAVANDTFNVGAAKYGTPRSDFQAVLDAAGKGGKVVSLPVKPAVMILRLLEAFKLSPLYKWVYETVDKESFVSIDRARTKLGWEPKYSNTDALLRNLEWYKANLNKFEGQSGVSHRVPWSQGILKVAKVFF